MVVENDSTFQQIIIVTVFEDSPATVAGLKVNDRIVEVNGKQLAGSDLEYLLDLLQKDGETVEIKAKRNGEMLTVTLNLQAMI